MMAFDVAVIGAGFAGLSAATALAESGARVLVLEARPNSRREGLVLQRSGDRRAGRQRPAHPHGVL